MQLKNNQTRNQQFYFHKVSGKKSELAVIHIPAGATVEMDDSVFKALLESRTEVQVMREDTVVLNKDNIGADIENDQKPLTIREFYETGETKVVNLVQELIKEGKLLVVERVKVGMADVDKVLEANGISVKDMPEDAKLALYDKLA